jgi:hypothetical protein
MGVGLGFSTAFTGEVGGGLISSFFESSPVASLMESMEGMEKEGIGGAEKEGRAGAEKAGNDGAENLGTDDGREKDEVVDSAACQRE